MDIEKYHAKIESERIMREKTIRDSNERKERELREHRDPNLLQRLLKAEMGNQDAILIEDREIWIKNVELSFITARKEYNAILCQKINDELNNNQMQRLDKETQERIRIDLLRVKGNNKYAAEKAHERLKRLNIISGYTEETA